MDTIFVYRKSIKSSSLHVASVDAPSEISDNQEPSLVPVNSFLFKSLMSLAMSWQENVILRQKRRRESIVEVSRSKKQIRSFQRSPREGGKSTHNEIFMYRYNSTITLSIERILTRKSFRTTNITNMYRVFDLIYNDCVTAPSQ